MSEPPERPAQPGAEMHVPKDAVAGLQAALDATFNAVQGGPEEVARELRGQLDRHGVADAMSDEWVTDVAGRRAGGEPVAVEPGDA